MIRSPSRCVVRTRARGFSPCTRERARTNERSENETHPRYLRPSRLASFEFCGALRHRRVRRTRSTWADAKLAPIGLHAARHTAASVMIDAGVNVKALSTFMGDSSITITLDRYGHFLPGRGRRREALPLPGSNPSPSASPRNRTGHAVSRPIDAGRLTHLHQRTAL